MSDDLRESALEYHRLPTPGKIAVTPTKPLANQHDLALAYTPGVAEACNAIAADPGEASTLTARANLVGVVTNGTAVLGLGAMGMPVDNIIVTDKFGVVWRGRKEEMDERKERYAKDTKARRLAEVIEDADIFLGLSAPNVLTAEMVDRMCARPLIMALANPTPEITPELVRTVRPNAVIATGRSDYPNQVNNVLCFPYIFRGALDVGATVINEAMKIACVKAIADLAMAPPSDIVAAAYGDTPLTFGPDYLIPKPFDPRLILEVAPAVAKAAMESGVATRPIKDFDVYRASLSQFVFRSGLIMRPVFERARQDPKRLVYAEGEDER